MPQIVSNQTALDLQNERAPNIISVTLTQQTKKPSLYVGAEVVRWYHLGACVLRFFLCTNRGGGDSKVENLCANFRGFFFVYAPSGGSKEQK